MPVDADEGIASGDAKLLRDPVYGNASRSFWDQRWIDEAAEQALVLKQSLCRAADDYVGAASSGISQVFSYTNERLHEAKAAMDSIATEYANYENVALGKIKEGVVIAAMNPGLSCGIVFGVALVGLKRPRRFLIHNIRHFFISEESLLAGAEAKVKELRQSMNMVTNECKKLEERALKAEEELRKGLQLLKTEGSNVRCQLHRIRELESSAVGLKDLVAELPLTDASKFRPEVSSIATQLKSDKKALNAMISRITNFGI